jgi:ABC-2 type transport system ATP-binding protein
MARIGFLPEHFRFHQWLTATGFLDMHGRLIGLSSQRRAERIPQVLDRVGLADKADTKLGEFSKGMTQRIGLAQALIGEPELVFLDEPTSALDPLGRREVRDIIRELRDRGVTVFLNSHLLSEVEVTCDRVAIVKDGSVVRTGSLDELTGAQVEIEITADGLSPELVAGLERWGRAARHDGRRLTIVVDTQDAVPALAAWLVDGGADLHALVPRRLSLEELFVHIVGDEK